MSIDLLRKALQTNTPSLAPQLPASVAVGLALPAAVLGVVLIGMNLHLVGMLAWTAAIVMIAFVLKWRAAAGVIAALTLSAVLLWRLLLGEVAILSSAELMALLLLTLLAATVGQLIAREMRQRDNMSASKSQLDVLATTLESVFEASQDCIKLLSTDGSVRSINGRGLKLIGAESADQMIGQSWFSFWGAEQQKMLASAWHKVLTRGYAEFNGTCRILTGERRNWRNTFTLVRAATQNQTHVICVSSDVTDNINLQHTLSSNVAQLSGLLNNIDDISFALDSNWVIHFANQSGEQLCAHMERPNAVGRSLWEIFPLKQGDPVSILIRRAMEEKTTQRCEYFFTPRQIWLSITAFPIANGINILARDITRLKETQQFATADNARLQIAQNIAGFGDWSFDYNQGSLHFSPRAVAILELENCSQHEYKKCLLDRLSARDRMALVQAIINCTEAAPNIDLMVRLPAQDGSEKHLHWIGRLLTDERGNATSMLGAIQDVSEHQQAQQALAGARRFLRDLVDVLPQKIMVVDKNGRYRINSHRESSRSDFYNSDEIAGNFFESSDFSDHDAALVKAMHKAARDICSGAIERFEHECEMTVDGERRRILLQALPLTSDSERMAVFIYNDITRDRQEKVSLLQKNNVVGLPIPE